MPGNLITRERAFLSPRDPLVRRGTILSSLCHSGSGEANARSVAWPRGPFGDPLGAGSVEAASLPLWLRMEFTSEVSVALKSLLPRAGR